MIETLTSYLSHSFVKYALVAGVLISLCAALLGVTLVLKRYSMIGDGLSHVAFGATAIASVLGIIQPLKVTLPITIIAAIILLGINSNKKIKGDAAIAMISVGALALGYLLLNIFSASSNVSGDVCTTLFGSKAILTLTKEDVILCVVLTVIVILVFLLLYHKIFAVTFDENFASATGTKTKAINTLIAIITAVVIVLAMKLVGALLISALIIFPALSAMRIFKSFLSVIISSVIFSVACAVIGILIAILYETPVGSTIVVVNIATFAICTVIGKTAKR